MVAKTKPVDKDVLATDASSDEDVIEGTEASNKPKYDPSELLAIFDALMFEYQYREKYYIRKLEVEFRTRTSEELTTIVSAIDISGHNTYAAVEYLRSMENLKTALTRYNGKDVSKLNVEEKAAFINKLPSPVVHALINKLVEFDSKVEAAVREGEENF